MIQRRPAYVLLEMLAVLFVVAVGLGLVTSLLDSIRYAQRRIADSANRTAVTEDFLRCLTGDVRHATSARVHGVTDEGAYQELEIGSGANHVTYQFFKNRVERAASADGTLAAKRWAPMTATVSMAGGAAAAPSDLVEVTVFWHTTERYDPRADRRFDVAVRCIGERYDDVD